MAYNKPTLIETYAEIHFAAETLTEARFFEIVPQLKVLGFSDIEMASAGISFDIKQGLTPREKQRVRCWKPGRTELVQVGEDLVVVNLTGLYPGWDAFRRLFQEALRAIEIGLGKVDFASLNFVAIDQFVVPKARFVLSDYLNVGGAIVPQWYAATGESLDMDLGRGLLAIDNYNRQIHIDVRAAQDPVKVTFRTQFHNRVPDGAKLIDVLSALHDESNSTFESIISDRVRTEIMGGPKT